MYLLPPLHIVLSCNVLPPFLGVIVFKSPPNYIYPPDLKEKYFVAPMVTLNLSDYSTKETTKLSPNFVQ